MPITRDAASFAEDVVMVRLFTSRMLRTTAHPIFVLHANIDVASLRATCELPTLPVDYDCVRSA